MRVRLVFSMVALHHTLLRMGYRKLDRPFSAWIQYQWMGFHILVKMCRGSNPMNPSHFIELMLHYDKPNTRFPWSPIPHVNEQRQILYGPEIDFVFSQIALQYAKTLEIWALEEKRQKESALLRISKEGMDTREFIDERL